ncbi:hypothetical protein SG34_000785 [Thalassomonas viridans]|uniref:DUF3630 family protein n=1 Tax=Thalassomonas viridans TaxID=137584 RepID=A0AAF0C987_9GAMM|nr:hypothetical protein [Thalassomonas viridans]WDE05518.1 hypothetical protein SG34_000785 [Thalassomonas viridans]
MSQTSPYLPAKLAFPRQQMITLVFNQYWDQEDIEELSGLIFSVLGQASPKNTVTGADREDIHFYWRDRVYMLYFETNSQSCWIEAEMPENTALLAEMFALLAPALS